MRITLFLLMILLCACAHRQPEFEVQSTPKYYAWYLRTTIKAKARRVSGLPLAQFNSNWCAANTLRIQDFPAPLRQYLREDLANQLAEVGGRVGFSMEFPFGKNGPDRVRVGVFHDCKNGKRGTFVYATKNGALLDSIEFMPSSFAVLSNSKYGLIWQECFSCDVAVRLNWNWEQQKFGVRQSLIPQE